MKRLLEVNPRKSTPDNWTVKQESNWLPSVRGLGVLSPIHKTRPNLSKLKNQQFTGDLRAVKPFCMILY